MPRLSLAKLERHLYSAADRLRQEGLDAATYKDYIFGMLFLKRCSDVYDAEREKLVAGKVEQGMELKQAEKAYGENPDYYDGFFVPERARWLYLIERLNDATVYMFAESAGKKGGDFYTPRDVIRLMVRVLKPAPGMSVYDPTCGSGGMLIISREFIEQSGGDPTNLRLCGQVNDASAWSICRLNMLLHGVPGADIQLQDTLLHPQHKDAGELERFDRVIANPPFSQNYSRPFWHSRHRTWRSGSEFPQPRPGSGWTSGVTMASCSRRNRAPRGSGTTCSRKSGQN
jgi:type I restriction-modification system DNA methylase subunit